MLKNINYNNYIYKAGKGWKTLKNWIKGGRNALLYERELNAAKEARNAALRRAREAAKATDLSKNSVMKGYETFSIAEADIATKDLWKTFKNLFNIDENLARYIFGDAVGNYKHFTPRLDSEGWRKANKLMNEFQTLSEGEKALLIKEIREANNANSSYHLSLTLNAKKIAANTRLTPEQEKEFIVTKPKIHVYNRPWVYPIVGAGLIGAGAFINNGNSNTASESLEEEILIPVDPTYTPIYTTPFDLYVDTIK